MSLYARRRPSAPDGLQTDAMLLFQCCRQWLITLCGYPLHANLRRWVFLFCFIFTIPVWAAPAPELTLDGGSSELRDNIRHYLTIADETCSAPLWRLKSLLADAQDEIERAAQALGYYQLTYTSKLTQEKDCWQLQLNLVPNAQIKITELQIDIQGAGNDDDIFKSLIAKPDVHIGDPLNHGIYENLKSKITTLATSHGYFDGRFDRAQIIVNVAENSAALALVYNTGERYRIGDIRMTHNILDDNFLRRYLNIQTGDAYDTDKLLELKTYYNATNYFSIATASPDLQNLHDHTVDIDVQLEERKRYAYSVGAGADNTGPRILLGFEDRYINDSGHSIKADMSQSAIKTSTQVAYTIPLSQPSYEFLKIYSGYDKEETDTSFSKKNTLGASYTYYQRNHWLHTYAINVEDEDSKVADENEIASHLIIPSVTFSRTQTDGSPYPLAGWSVAAKLSGSPQTLGSDVSFEQLDLRGRYVKELTRGRLLLRTEIGVTDANIGELPASVRYFAGGPTSVRGYDYQSLGPENEMGKVIGGNNLLVSSIEYDYRFKPNWAVATFYDVGNAADDFHLHFKRGAGVGLRWISPIGPVRIDIAKGLDYPSSTSPYSRWHLHVSMGPDL